METQHQSLTQKSPAEDVLSKAAEETWPTTGAYCHLLHAVIESILCSSITVWFGATTKKDINRLQRTIRSAEKIIGIPLPSLQVLFLARTKKRAGKITGDPTHPGHHLFELLPSGRRYRSLYATKSKHKHSFFPSAVKLMNS